jgi:hypothetical protein
MNKINLLGDLVPDPLVKKPSKEKALPYWSEKEASSVLEQAKIKLKSKQTIKRPITYCSCGNHPVNPRKDIYKQHNHWVAQQDFKLESNNTRLQGIKGIGISGPKPYVPTYDFSGEDFETDWDEIRKVSSKND